MTERSAKPRFASRPGDVEAWVRSPETVALTSGKDGAFTARLTIDVTPALRGRIKVVAFRRGLTVADMLRRMLEDAFPDEGGTS
jgi:hypothetical protein